MKIETSDGRTLDFETEEGKEIYRHSTSHIMAHAVKRLFPDAKLGIGPAIEDGFYYDFDIEDLSEEDLDRISEEMEKLIEEDFKFEKIILPKGEARKLLEERGEDYKIELLSDIEDAEVTFYKNDNFIDLCRGPHVKSTGQIKHFKLLEVAGAYWRGNENRRMLKRIYGTSFPTVEGLERYVKRLELAKERDHRKLGRELDLFSMHQEVGAGLVLWHPDGARIRAQIEDFWREKHRESGYELVYTPHIGKANLWAKSGHLKFYKEGMYAPMDIDDQKYYIKPMNCPFHIMIYKSEIRSYRDLPLRWAELGTVYRYERSGVLHGLMRVRGFTQDDAHIFCQPEEIDKEIGKVFDFSMDMLAVFGFEDFKIRLSVRDPEHSEKYVGADQDWEKAEGALIKTLEDRGVDYEKVEGEAVFYGPKIDIDVTDSLGRNWQLTTIQFDFNLAERFDLEFMGSDGQSHRPYVVHRALLGALERFFGILIEHYGGAFPVWLAPVQAVILPITDDNDPYAEEVEEKLTKAGIRADAWTKRSATLSHKIREAQLKKIPYMLIVGNREEESGQVALRLRSEEDLGPRSVANFIQFAQEKIAHKEQL